MVDFAMFHAAVMAITSQPLWLDGASNFARLLAHMVKFPDRDFETELRASLYRHPSQFVAANVIDPQMIEARGGPVIIPGGRSGKATAVVSMRGIALYDLEFQPYCYSMAVLEATMNRLAGDDEIGQIILDVDSPGGTVTGVPEAADAIHNAAKRKQVTAVVNPMAASAAYWLVSQASSVITIPSGSVGSIGVYMMHVDFSEAMANDGIKVTYIYAGPHKVEGNPFEPLAEDAREFLQGQVNDTYSSFIKAVARGRGVTAATVKSDFGGGRVLDAKAALEAGMIDKTATVAMALKQLGLIGSDDNQSRSNRRRRLQLLRHH